MLKLKKIFLITAYLFFVGFLYSQNETDSAVSPTAIDAGFTISAAGGQCMGNEIIFSPVNQNPLITYEWAFGDRDSSKEMNPVHVYKQPGYYNVSLGITGFDDTAKCFSEIIYIIPTTETYNINCFSEGLTYTQNGDFSAQSETWTYGVGNNPWDVTSPGPVLVKGIIRIPAGVNVTIENMTFEFDPNGKVIVEREGTLTLDGATLKGLSTCGTMWQGVEVWGVSTANHFLWNGSINNVGQNQQGKLVMINDATIMDAHIGVLLGRTRICIPPCKPYFPGYSGGIINADHASFYENAIAIKFLPFLPCTGVCLGHVNDNAGKIINNTTITGGELPDPGYSIGNSAGYEYPTTNTYCPQYANANAYTPKGHAVTGIYLWGVRNVTIDNDVFQNSLIEGIKSFDSPYNVSNTSFTKLDYGIRIFNTTSSVLGHRIYDNHYSNSGGFKNIHLYNIQLEGSKFDIIKNNSFNDLSFYSPTSVAGLLLNNSSNFNVNDNNFRYINLGINCINSSTGGGNIASLLNADGNIFTECPLDIQTGGRNHKLQIHCNTSDNSDLTVPSTSNWENWGIFTNQGVLDFSVDAQGPAGNAFYPPLNNAKKVINNHLSLSSLWPPYTIYPILYTYYRHGGNAYPERIPSPASLQWIINDQSSAYNPSTSCIPCKTLLCNTSALEADSIKIVALQDEYNTVLSSIDKGQTQQLLAAINSNMSQGNLKNKLLNASPLSDTVLIATINRPSQLSPGNFKNVMLPNSPVSDRVRYDLDIKIASLPPGIAKQISDAQANNYPYRTLTAISRELSEAQNDYQLNLNNYVQRLMENDSLDKAMSILDRQTDNETKQMLFGTYLNDSNLVEAQSRLDNYVPSTVEETDWKTLNTLLLAYAQQEKTVFEMTSAEETYIRTLANNNSGSQASINAQAILRLVYGEEFPLPPLTVNNLKTNEQESDTVIDAIDFLGNNIPNPFNNTTLIPYRLSDSTSKAYMNIFDIKGNKLKEVLLTEKSGSVIISLENYDAGVYLYSLMVNGYAIQTKRMVLIK